MEAMIHEITGVKVLSLHRDISTVTGEEIVIFTLAESPRCALKGFSNQSTEFGVLFCPGSCP